MTTIIRLFCSAVLSPLMVAISLSQHLGHGCRPPLVIETEEDWGYEPSPSDFGHLLAPSELVRAQDSWAAIDNARSHPSLRWAAPWDLGEDEEGQYALHITGSGRMRVRAYAHKLVAELSSPSYEGGERPYCTMQYTPDGQLVIELVEGIDELIGPRDAKSEFDGGNRLDRLSHVSTVGQAAGLPYCGPELSEFWSRAKALVDEYHHNLERYAHEKEWDRALYGARF